MPPIRCFGIDHTSASVKSYQLVKVVSGGRGAWKKFKFGITTTFSNWTISLFWGRAAGKSSIFLLHWLKNIYLIILSRGQTLVAACLLLACCLPAASLLLACYLLLLAAAYLLLLTCSLPAACCCLLLFVAAFCCCFLLLLTCCLPAACLLLLTCCSPTAVTFHYLMWLLRIAAVPWGWCDFSRLMWLKYGACTEYCTVM